jgi:predicted nucleic acid-binding protein
MGKKFLIDTNTVLDYMGGKLSDKAKKFISQVIDDEINISVINKIELLGFSLVDQELIDFVSFSTVWGLDEEIVEKTIEVRRMNRIKLPDAVIAATALINDFTLITRDSKDFNKIHGLKLVNPFEV